MAAATLADLPGQAWLLSGLVALCAVALGGLPFAYWIVRLVTGEDITAHGTGNVGAMNVRRTTGSWGWFALAVVLDVSKGLLAVAGAEALARLASAEWTLPAPTAASLVTLAMQTALAGAVLGHNYSPWLAFAKHALRRTGKGLAAGAGALFAYDWRYFLVVVIVALLMIALTRYLLAGQVAAAVALPLAAIALRSPDWGFALGIGTVVYLAHHKRFMGLLAGREPKLYISDRMGPRG